ncbi:hypothetical protein [Cohnella sp. GbtcB17]|uniref:hypothetical protein n=1 Tax=Cohnella sp. GbtcB17 TaxID=2824762 RepID=UPI001C3079EA|nr:hypothetical protein [Cohnella sp. GbtcB17]
MAVVKVQLKDTLIEFDDVIQLETAQLQQIIERAETKTQAQWRKPSTKGVRILLTEKQKQAVLEYKNRMVNGHTGESLIEADLIRFSHHSKERIASRIDKDIFPDPDTLIGLADLLIRSQELGENADWRGFEGLSYSFNGDYDGKACTMAIVFDGPMVVVTVITDEPTPAAYALGTLNPSMTEKLQKARLEAVERAKRNGKRK